ncbi:MAG: gliding motility-associated C-terminal domain-containing protein [Flavobacteriales bacterium]
MLIDVLLEGEVAVEGFEIYVPNAFTPNEDGINDVFLPQLIGVTDYKLVIYNRWGEVIFETSDQDEPWLGQVKDGEHFVQNEIYQYRIFVRDLLGYPHDFEGTVTILR